MHYARFAGSPANLMLRGPAVTLAPDDGAGGGEAGGDDSPPDDGGGEDDDDHDFGDGDTSGGEDDDGDGGEDDGLEEVEWGGAKHRLPPVIREALARHDALNADAQDLVNTRQSIERQRAAEAERFTALRADYGRAEALALQVEEFKSLDWAELQRADPATAQSLWFEYQQAKEKADDAQRALKGKEEAHSKARAEASTLAMQECGKALKRSIPGFDGKLATRLVEFGVSKFGISRDEVREMADPRVWMLLHAAMGNEKQGRKDAVKEKVAKQQAVAPAAKAGGGRGGPPPALSDRASAAAWMKARNAALAKRK